MDDDQTVYIADAHNHRIVEWTYGAASGRVVAGGNGQENRTDQFHNPTDVIVEKETDILIICDYGNRRVMRWSRRSGTTSGETIIENIDCWGLAMDDQRFLYVSDYIKHEVRLYREGETNGAVVAGGNGKGDHLNQLNCPGYVFVDRDQSVYVSNLLNHRVLKWVADAKKGIVVAGAQGHRNYLTRLADPHGVFVDQLGTVYVADWGNNRVMRWGKGVTQGDVIAGGNGQGEQANQLNYPIGLSFDRHGNLYVVDNGNQRAQRFSIEGTN